MEEILIDNVTFKYEDAENPVFTDLALSLPAGLVSLVGPNGAGKSTLLLLAGARVLPQKGRVLIRGIDSKSLTDESEKQRYVSFIYQNMEFETEEPIAGLLEYVYSNGFHEKKTAGFLGDLIEVFELSKCLDRKTQELSKGELQRAILAFSLLYGSAIVMMDEPVFSLEPRQKEKSFEFIHEYAKQSGVSVYYSVHELDLSEKYSDQSVLFYKNGKITVGATGEILSKKNLEEAYDAPFSALKQKESLFREYLRG
jgi:iron complex transport system ATP-binding protein